MLKLNFNELDELKDEFDMNTVHLTYSFDCLPLHCGPIAMTMCCKFLWYDGYTTKVRGFQVVVLPS